MGLPSAPDTQTELQLPLKDYVIAVRRELHRLAEPGWCEVASASKVAQTLIALGLDVKLGRQVIAADARMGLPQKETLEFFFNRALQNGADISIAEQLRDGYTGVVGFLRTNKPGPKIALRFDLDANQGSESNADNHFPFRNGFASTSVGIHHNCGHDGHTAIGLSVARALTEMRDELTGEVRFIFQPAEEGLRGAKAMVAAGVLDGVDVFVASHLGVRALRLGEIIAGYNNILGSIKFDVEFTGVSAHAAISPHVGRNALMAACVATQGLMSIPRHGESDTRINVGLISGGDARNAVPASARISVELRAETTDALDFLRESAERICSGAAVMYGVRHNSKRVGESCAASSDQDLVRIIESAARGVPGVTEIRHDADFKASDDAAEMMKAVQTNGGRAVYIGIGTPLKAVHHNPLFDFDERALLIGVQTLLHIISTVMDGRER